MKKLFFIMKRLWTSPLQINTLFNYGLTAFQAGMNRKAIEKFTEVMELDPEYHSLYLYLALSHEKEGELKKALKQFFRESNMMNLIRIYFSSAEELLQSSAKMKKELNCCKRRLNWILNLSRLLLLLSKFYLKREYYHDVLALLQGMRDYGIEEPQFLWDEAAHFWHLEEYSQALNKYEEAYTYFKNDPNFLTEYGYLLMEEGKREKAAELFTKVLEKDPSNESIQDVLERLRDDLV